MSFFQNRVDWRLGLATLLSRKSKPRVNYWPVWTFCPAVLQLAWWFSSSACFTHVHPLADCQSRATREIQSRVPTSLHNLEHFFTLSHTLPLHDSHLNTGFLSAELQENQHGIKPTRWLIKFNLTRMHTSTRVKRVFKKCTMCYLKIVENMPKLQRVLLKRWRKLKKSTNPLLCNLRKLNVKLKS